MGPITLCARIQNIVVTKLLGPALITLFASLAVGVSYLFFTLLLPFNSLDNPSTPWVHLLIYLFLIVNAVYNYAQCIRLSPGYTTELPELKDQSMHDYKYCQKCQAMKPPRTHHCRNCNKCIIKMDHHCPWINNCVGHHNHIHFLLFLVYTWLGSLYFLTLVWRPFQVSRAGNLVYGVDYELMLLYTTLGFIICGALSMFLFWNLYLISTAQTTIEVVINKAGVSEYDVHPYDLGVKQNWFHFLNLPDKGWWGYLSLLWPQRRFAEGNGLQWPIRNDVMITREDGEILNMASNPRIGLAVTASGAV